VQEGERSNPVTKLIICIEPVTVIGYAEIAFSCIEGASNLRKTPVLGGGAIALFLAQPSFGLNEEPF
jgi:hypothetical protein